MIYLSTEQGSLKKQPNNKTNQKMIPMNQEILILGWSSNTHKFKKVQMILIYIVSGSQGNCIQESTAFF